MMKKVYIIFTVLLLVIISGCKHKSLETGYNYLIMNSNEIIDDLVLSIGGDFIETNVVIRKGIDPHTYTANERDIIRITDSSLIIYNGASLEGRLEWALSKIGNITPAVSIIKNIPKEKLIYNNKKINPHIWHDVELWMDAASFVTEKLSQIGEKNQQIYFQNEDKLLYAYSELHKYIKTQVSKIPKEKRILVTEHDAFAYFGKAYGFETLSLQGISTHEEVTSSDINKLADILIEKNVDTLFLEATVSDRNIRLLQSTLKDKGHHVKIGGALYSDTLGRGNSYEAMMHHNVDTIVNSLSDKY